jgi:hypothetical protein
MLCRDFAAKALHFVIFSGILNGSSILSKLLRWRTNVTGQIAITLDGRPFEVSQLSQLPRESVAGLLLHLAALQAALAARLWSGLPTSRPDGNDGVGPAGGTGDRLPEPSEYVQSSGSTVGSRGSMGPAIGVTKAVRAAVCLSVKQAAARIGLSPWTLYHWIENGKLDEARGLRRLGRRRLIDWQVFQICLERGALK